ncbi:type II toxin-antitoxin system VapC family toxin [Dyadobacter fermentans]|uniref:type II toxin-antitoxin system VapC family toxin n=1 Tax=Dyadobacter fermentans TaxID=94254 RepID=UPI001CBA71FD|nr:PIN domain-containing protein [Dyadobacter fermentans]MBZ1360935.1 PIN domain-containing protein [Dyadobacter fermentans]
MAASVFLDANIVLDFLLKRKDYENAREVISLMLEKKIKAFISPSILHIVSYWLTKAYGSAKSKDLLLLFLSDISIVDANQQVVTLALTSPIDDIEDALQYYTALHHKMDFFISNDRKFQKQALTLLPVYSLPQFLKLFA